MKVSSTDVMNLNLLRDNVNLFIGKCGEEYDDFGNLLDIGPMDFNHVGQSFNKAKIYTMDIDKKANVDFIGDICEENKNIKNNFFDYVVCTEVLEHTNNPFNAIKEILRILNDNGLLFLSTPFNFRIHGPLPDNWRFTEHGLKALLKDFEIIQLNALESDRFLMPIQYTVIAKKTKASVK